MLYAKLDLELWPLQWEELEYLDEKIPLVRAELAKLEPRLLQCAEIVEELGKNPCVLTTPLVWRCLHCGFEVARRGCLVEAKARFDNPSNHPPTCLFRRAVEAREA